MPVAIKSTGGGSVTLTAPSTASDLTVTLPATSGGTFLTSPLAAGTTTVPPIDFTAGTNMTTPDTGAMEYDGTKLMFTPIGTQRGIVPGMQFYRLNAGYDFTSNTTPASLYGVGVTLSSSTVYAFEGLFVLYRSTSTTGTSRLSFGGTATLNNILYQTHSVFEPGSIPLVDSNNNMAISNTAAVTTFTVSASVNTISAFITGTVSVNAGGTFIPQYSQSVTGNTTTNQAGSYFMIYPIGAAGSNTSVGTWA
jgi:hypothetical protein